MIERIPFGRTGHLSTRAIFGAAALGAMSPDRAVQTLDTLLEYGVNHIDTAASYGDSELRLAPWLAEHRGEVFLATKTGEREGDAARRSLERSLERLGVDRVDMIQLHHVVDREQWQVALGSGGALEALIQAQEEGLVHFLGVTGHGTRVAERHLESLERHPFDSVLLPYNWSMMQQPEYADDFERLMAVCEDRGVAVQTIKSIARRRWREDDDSPRFSWYEPLRGEDAIRKAVDWVLGRHGVFLNTSSDATLLTPLLDAAARPGPRPSDEEMARLHEDLDVEPLFIRGYSEEVQAPA